MFLEECKNVFKEKKISRYIMDDIEIFSDSNRENSDRENTDRENSDKKLKNTDITHILKLTFEAYKNIFLNFFVYYKSG